MRYSHFMYNTYHIPTAASRNGTKIHQSKERLTTTQAKSSKWRWVQLGIGSLKDCWEVWTESWLQKVLRLGKKMPSSCNIHAVHTTTCIIYGRGVGENPQIKEKADESINGEVLKTTFARIVANWHTN
ncbi:uncharacterized protein [Montipora foliosa]|uniref:uncharacterized protein n=1 Tax=Montipora foliosa TaxID=591990 RepID=UPI0035F0FABB